ncbi:hypothetical protein [Streptomyces sp. NPDC003710]
MDTAHASAAGAGRDATPAASQQTASADTATKAPDQLKESNLSPIVSIRGSDLQDGQVIKIELNGRTVDVMVRIADMGDGTKTISLSTFDHPDQEARIVVSTDNKDAAHVIISIRVGTDGSGHVLVSHPKDVGVGFESSDAWHISERITPSLSSVGNSPAKVDHKGGANHPNSPPGSAARTAPEGSPVQQGPEISPAHENLEEPGLDGRTDSEIRTELEIRGQASYGQLVQEMGRGPLDPAKVPARFVEWDLERTGRLHPQFRDLKDPTVLDKVWREHPTQENRFIGVGVVGPESKVAAEKAAGEEGLRQAYLQGIALGLAGVKRGSASEGLVKPAPWGRSQEAPPPGFHRNEMLEVYSRERYFADAFEPAAKQPGVDWVGGTTRKHAVEHTVTRGQVHVLETVVGGEWIQGKRLIETSRSLPEKLVRDNVAEAARKFFDPVRQKESSSNARKMSDGTTYRSVLRNPDSLLIHIEVPPELTSMNPEKLTELQQAAEAELRLWVDSTGMYEGLPIRVQVVPTP